MRKLAFLIIYCIQFLNCTKFFFHVEQRSMKCFGEYFTEGTAFIYNINSNSREMRIRLFDPNGNTLFNKENSITVKIAFTANEIGNHQLCVDNYSNYEIKIDFELLAGVAARDYSELARTAKFKPIELHVTLLSYLVSKT